MKGKTWIRVALAITFGLGTAEAISTVDGSNSLRASNMPLPQPGDPEADFSERETQVEETAIQFIDALGRGDYQQAHKMLSRGLASIDNLSALVPKPRLCKA
ncbi:MAG: hypothetical protein AB4040_17005 [Synechococcus sp.]